MEKLGVEAVKEVGIVGRNHGPLYTQEGGFLEIELGRKRRFDALSFVQTPIARLHEYGV